MELRRFQRARVNQREEEAADRIGPPVFARRERSIASARSRATIAAPIPEAPPVTIAFIGL